MAVPYMPSRNSPLGLGKVDLDAHGAGGRIFRFAHSRHRFPEDLASQGIDGELGGISHAGDHHIAIGNLHDHPHQVRSLDGQERRLRPLRCAERMNAPG